MARAKGGQVHGGTEKNLEGYSLLLLGMEPTLLLVTATALGFPETVNLGTGGLVFLPVAVTLGLRFRELLEGGEGIDGEVNDLVERQCGQFPMRGRR